MTSKFSDTESNRKPAQAVGTGTPIRDAVVPDGRTLDAVAWAICQDARCDAVEYVLRSDIGHDGE
jgi:hypothetical protein